MSEQVGKRYARALFELAREKNCSEQVAGELAEITALAQTLPEMAEFLDSKRLGREEKKKIVTELFREKISSLTFNFLQLLIDKGREAELPEVGRYFQKLWRESQGVVVGEVTGAVPLSQEEVSRLEVNLSQGLGRQVRLVAKVDTSLLGGLVVKIGDLVMDGTIHTRLARLGEKMAGGITSAGERIS